MFGPVDLLHRIRRQLDMLAWPPVPRGDDEITDVPVGVVSEEVLDMAKVARRWRGRDSRSPRRRCADVDRRRGGGSPCPPPDAPRLRQKSAARRAIRSPL